MQVRVLGGTSFVGRAIGENLLARGHTPTLFNRGRTGADLDGRDSGAARQADRHLCGWATHYTP